MNPNDLQGKIDAAITTAILQGLTVQQVREVLLQILRRRR